MSNNDVEVKVGAETSGLDRGMADAAKKVGDGARGMENALKSSADNMQAIAKGLQSQLAGLFSLGAIVSFVKSTKDAVTQAEAAFKGLEAVANYSGVGIGRAMQEAQKLASDGMLTVAESSKALQNLLSRGYSIDQAVDTLNRLKDAAAFNRQASLSMGEAVMSATEGLKNENSILVDNAGVTKNVAKMWDEYAKAHGKSAQQLTQAEKIQAEYNGVMAETEAQVGNAEKAMGGLQGQQAKMNASWNDMKIQIGEALVPAFAKLAEWGSWLINNVFVPMVKAIKIVGAAFGAVAVDIGNVWNAVTNFDFSKLGGQMKANAQQFKETVDEIVSAKAGSSFQASGDNGKRRDPKSLTGGGAPDKDKKKKQGPIDVFDDNSFITKDKDTAKFIKEQYDFENDVRREAVREANAIELAGIEERADYAAQGSVERIELLGEVAQKVGEIYGLESDQYRDALAKMREAAMQNAQQRLEIEKIAAQSVTEARLFMVDEAERQAQREVELGLITMGELLAQEQEFEQQRYEIKRQALEDQLALIDPTRDPVAAAEINAQLEELERQHQASMTEIRYQAAREQAAPMMQAVDQIGSAWQGLTQQLLQGQISLGNYLKGMWQSVVSTISSMFAKMVADWIMQKIKMMIFGKAASLSEITTQAGKAGAGGVASMAAAPWPLNMTAPAFGAAMSAAAMAFAPMASAAGGFDIPAGVNPLTQLHAKEMVLPAKYADVIRGMSEGGGDGQHGPQSMTFHVSAMDAAGVKRFFLENKVALADAIKSAARDFKR